MILAERKVSLLNGELIVTSEKIDTVNGINEEDTITQNKLEEILEFLASTEILSFVNMFIDEISLSGNQKLIDLYAKNNFQGNYTITHENKHLQIEVTHKSQSTINHLHSYTYSIARVNEGGVDAILYGEDGTQVLKAEFDVNHKYSATN